MFLFYSRSQTKKATEETRRFTAQHASPCPSPAPTNHRRITGDSHCPPPHHPPCLGYRLDPSVKKLLFPTSFIQRWPSSSLVRPTVALPAIEAEAKAATTNMFAHTSPLPHPRTEDTPDHRHPSQHPSLSSIPRLLHFAVVTR